MFNVNNKDMYWQFTTTDGWRAYNPETHELKPKKGFIEKEIEKKQAMVDNLVESEANYIKRVAEIKADIKKDIKDLKEQLNSG